MNFTNSAKPKVTVFMPAYNTGAYIKQSIRSILEQTYRDFEFLIIEDGSTDNTAEIIASFKDARIRFVQHQKNLGLHETLNEGMRLATGDYIARMDSDDISLPTRLAKQVRFLDTHQEFLMVGSWATLIDKEGKKTGVIWKERTTPDKIPCTLLFKNCFAHPSVMIRRNGISATPFRPDFTPSEDYELWVQLAKKGKLGNLQEVLLLYRTHGSNISTTKQQEKDAAVRKIITGQLLQLGVTPTDEEFLIHKTNYGFGGKNVLDFLTRRETWLKKLLDANTKKNVYSEKSFKQTIAERWLHSCYANEKRDHAIWTTYRKSKLSRNLSYKENWRQILKFALKTLLKR